MARIRTIKPSFWSDDSVADLSRDARLLLIGLISFADDEGRFVASVSAISGYIFPHDDIPPAKIKKWLSEIVSSGMIRLYTSNRRDYGYFPNYHAHQRIDKPQKSSLPPPINGATRLPDPRAAAERFHE